MRGMEKALDDAKTAAGGNTGLAKLLCGEGIRITPQAISQWSKVPAERVLTVERLTGVPRHDLRPDLYPPPASEADAA